MVDLVYWIRNLWCFDILCLFSGGIYLSLGISVSYLMLSASFVTVSELFYGKVIEAFVILSSILLPIKSPVASAVFWSALFEAVLVVSVADCLAWSKCS